MKDLVDGLSQCGYPGLRNVELITEPTFEEKKRQQYLQKKKKREEQAKQKKAGESK